MAPRYVLVLPAVQDAHRTVKGNRRVQKAPGPPIFNQGFGDRIGLAIGVGAQPLAFGLDLLADMKGQLLPDQAFGEVRRGRDQHQRFHPVWPRHRRQQRHPAAHG